MLAKYKPVRIGFLVRPGSIEDLIRAAELNSLLWGGIRNPIIPVGVDPKDSEEMIDGFGVEVVYPVATDPNIEATLKRHPLKMTPFLHSHDIFYTGGRGEGLTPAYIDLVDNINHHWERYFKHLRKGSGFFLAKWKKDDPCNTLFTLSFGRINEELKFDRNYSKDFIAGMRARELFLGSTIPNFNPNYSLVGASAFELRASHSGKSPGVFVGDHENTEHLTKFWNYRATGGEVVFLPYKDLGRFKQSVQNFIDQRLKTEGTPGWYWPCFFFPSDWPESQIDELLSNFSITGRIQKIQHPSATSSESFFFKSFVAETEKSTDEDGNTVVKMQLPEMKFLSDDEEYRSRRLLALGIENLRETNDGDTLNIPPIKELENYFSREIHFLATEIRIKPGEITRIIETDEHSVSFRYIKHLKLIEKILEHCGLKTEVSQPHNRTKLLVDKMQRLEGARVFKITGVRKLIARFKSTESFTGGFAKQTINEGFHKFGDLFIEKREKGKLNPEQVFQYLLSHDFFRAGLDLTCHQCNLPSWLSLKEVDDTWTCRYCGFSDRMTAHLRNTCDWAYRKSGLLARDDNQDGAIPVILALLTLYRLSHEDFVFTYSLNLSFSKQEKCEIDFFVLSYSVHRGLEIGLAECKSPGSPVEQADITNMKKVRAALTAKGIKSFFIFAKTAEEFTPQELDMFIELEKEQVPFVLLTNKEMEPYHPYYDLGDPLLPHKYANCTEELVENSAHIHLKKHLLQKICGILKQK